MRKSHWTSKVYDVCRQKVFTKAFVKLVYPSWSLHADIKARLKCNLNKYPFSMLIFFFFKTVKCSWQKFSQMFGRIEPLVTSIGFLQTTTHLQIVQWLYFTYTLLKFLIHAIYLANKTEFQKAVIANLTKNLFFSPYNIFRDSITCYFEQ